METKMMRCLGIERLDCIKNETIRKVLEFAVIKDMLGKKADVLFWACICLNSTTSNGIAGLEHEKEQDLDC